MKLKKILSIIFLGSIIPIIGIPGTGENNEGDSGKDEKNTDGKEKETSNKDDGTKNNIENKNDTKLFSQEDVNSMIEKRLSRERKSFEKEFNSKLEREKMDETQKAKADKDLAEKKAETAIQKANARLVRSEINIKAAEMGLIDADAAYALIKKEDIDVDDSGNVAGVEEALKILISKKPWLLKKSDGSEQSTTTGDDQSSSGGQKKKFNMNEMIRKAAGR